jgi:NADH-quinone oxidoreductase subunit L
LHIVPLEHLEEPVFSVVDPRRLLNSDPDEALVTKLLIPGILVFLIGFGIAWQVYFKGGGAAERRFQAAFPRLYQLVFDKWRVDELYDELVVGSLEALAEASVWFDRWVVDGILARLTALLVTVWGHLLRLFQTGHAQAYAAVMVLGLFGLGWFVGVPQPAVIISGDPQTGQYSLSAAPGLGYSYRWDADGDGNFDSDKFGPAGQVTLTLEAGATREVRLQVKNAFGRVRVGSIQVHRPRRDESTAAVSPGAAMRAAAAASGRSRVPLSAVAAASLPVRGINP